jgi:hypothetical protein
LIRRAAALAHVYAPAIEVGQLFLGLAHLASHPAPDSIPQGTCILAFVKEAP